ncbi:hypothetical protein [Pseudoalteromonas sp. OOF1S-7]|uniref:hypothetical protein n=1 Tax=Pseudoalteromonas sp. OOF1S-7 TaxID=2917757 RepID=UPI001EF53B85|nr:hypothetical protein [Pseudoalteromonas sp. OOF1S-7]MCG7535992.1 hypothetical protein [Pseudoalteromonas sp. OOF1S-7]
MTKASGLALLCALWLLGCSSAPERDYQITTYQRQAAAWLAQGDRKRQQGAYQQALEYYDKAYRYASKRHDAEQMGLARLKQAAVNIRQGQLERAEQRIVQAEVFARFEQTELAPAIDFMRSKLAFKRGEQAQALALVAKLQTQFSGQTEKHIYYRWVGWQYAPASLNWAQAEQDIVQLAKLKADKSLSNVEIQSFVLYHNALWRTATGQSGVEPALDAAIAHFASLELTNWLVACFKVAVQYYSTAADAERAQYYQTRLTELSQTDD